jgi:putative transcriptional regulator
MTSKQKPHRVTTLDEFLAGEGVSETATAETRTRVATWLGKRPRAKSRMRGEIVEAMRALHKVGAVSGEALEKTTLRMLDRDAPPKVGSMSPSEIAAVRQRTGISQAVLAGFMNVAVNTVSQWERGERQPTGAALKLLNVVKHNGLDALR